MGEKILVELKRDFKSTGYEFLRFAYKHLYYLLAPILYLLLVIIVYWCSYLLGYSINWLALLGYSLYPGWILICLVYVIIEQPLRTFLSKFIVEEPAHEPIRSTIKNVPFQKAPVFNKPKPETITTSTAITQNKATASPSKDVYTEPMQPVIKAMAKIDYTELTKKRMEIGLAGELFVLKTIKRELMNIGRNDLAAKVEHVSLTNDSLGYDIVSYDRNGKKIFIEVKSTTDNRQTPFYLTDTEFENLKLADNYFIYRVFDLNIQTGNANYQIIDCKSDFQNKYKFQPASYKVSPLSL